MAHIYRHRTHIHAFWLMASCKNTKAVLCMTVFFKRFIHKGSIEVSSREPRQTYALHTCICKPRAEIDIKDGLTAREPRPTLEQLGRDLLMSCFT